MENNDNSKPSSKFSIRNIYRWLVKSKVAQFFGVTIVAAFLGWSIPAMLTHKPKAEIVYKRIEIDSIFKDSMFGDIPIQAFRFELTNVGDLSTDQLNISLNSFPEMDLGYDPNFVLIGNVSVNKDGTQLRNFDRRIPLVPNAITWIELSIFKPAFDSLNNIYKSKGKNPRSKIPSINIQYTEGMSGKSIVKE